MKTYLSLDDAGAAEDSIGMLKLPLRLKTLCLALTSEWGTTTHRRALFVDIRDESQSLTLLPGLAFRLKKIPRLMRLLTGLTAVIAFLLVAGWTWTPWYWAGVPFAAGAAFRTHRALDVHLVVLASALLALDFLTNDVLGWGTYRPLERVRALAARGENVSTPPSHAWLDRIVPAWRRLNALDLQRLQPGS